MLDPVSRSAGRLPFPHARPLDGLRATAILLVLFAHAGLGAIIPGGFGVTIFFFLSGYLITSLLRFEWESSGTVSLPGFYLKRVIRIFPPLYVTFLFCLLLMGAGLLDAPISWSGALIDLAYLTNYAGFIPHSPGFPMPLWSLDVEEHFYVVFPLLFTAGLAPLGGRRAALTCLSLCGVVLLVRIANTAALPDYSNNYYWTHTRIDSILFGCCLALWRNPILDGDRAWRPLGWHALAALAVLLLCFVIRADLFRETIRYSLQGGALFVLFAFCLNSTGPLRALLGSRPLKHVADWSYTLYLVHVPMIIMVEKLAPYWNPILRNLVAIGCAFLYSIAMRAAVEKPLLALRRSRARMAATI